MIDTTRVGPDAIAGRYLRRFWHPLLVADKLVAGQVLPLTILGSKLAVYRGEDGAVHCVDNRCAHRGAMLSVGRVEGDMLRCAYHGWAYGPDGQCRHQPLETGAYAERIRIGGYPVCEYLGLVFVYLGEGEPPVLPRFPEMESAAFVVAMIDEIPCNWFQHLENHLDQAHVAIAHSPAPPSGTEPDPVPTKVAAQATEWGICLTTAKPGDKPKYYQFGMPTAGLFAIYPDELPGQDGGAAKFNRSWQLFLGYIVPIDDERHFQVSVIAVFAEPEQAEAAKAVWSRFIAGAPGATRAAQMVLDGSLAYDDLVANCDFLPLAQDFVVVCSQGVVADRSRGVEHLGASDVGVVALRRLYEEELGKLAAGQPLRAFNRPEGLLPLPETSPA